MLMSLVYFRAIAILLIVTCHCYTLINMDMSAISFHEKILISLINGGTVLFVFISGFLFHHVFIPRYQFKKFITGKLKKLLIPYLILSIPILFLFLKGVDWSPYPAPTADTSWLAYMALILKYLISGKTVIGYWYIPFILVTFLMSPLHVAFARLVTCTQLTVIAVFLALSLVLHRPLDSYYVFHSVIYFLPVYLIGIFCSVHREKVYQVLKGKEFYLLTMAILIAIYQAWTGEVGNYRKEAFAYNGIDIFILQKIMLSIFLLVFLHRFEATKVKTLEFIAAISFSIYFLHGYLLLILFKLIKYFSVGNFEALAVSPWLNLIIIVTIFVAVIAYIATTLKKLMPKYVKYIIGY